MIFPTTSLAQDLLGAGTILCLMAAVAAAGLAIRLWRSR